MFLIYCTIKLYKLFQSIKRGENKIIKRLFVNTRNILKNIKNDIKYIFPAIIILAVYYIVTELLFHEFCPIRIITGFPCPGCGLTRSVLLILHLDWYNAFFMNPSAFLWIIFSLYLLWQRYIKNRWFKHNMIIVIIICLFTLSWFAVRFPQYYPNTEPYTCNSDNIIHRLSTIGN